MRASSALRTAPIAALAALALALPAGSEATVTVGSNLVNAPDSGVGGPGTWVVSALPAVDRAPGGIVSPVNGVVTSWRIRYGNPPVVGAALRVVRPFGSNLFSGAGISETRLPGANATSSFPASLPISKGDLVGYDTPAGNTNSWNIEPGAITIGFFAPPLADGDPGRAPNTTYGNSEVLINAEIEPTADFTIKKVKRLSNGKLRVTVDLPNPGALTAKAKKVLKKSTATVEVQGEKTLVLKPTKSAREALADDEKVKAKLRIRFTPTFGVVNTERKSAKLKP